MSIFGDLFGGLFGGGDTSAARALLDQTRGQANDAFAEAERRTRAAIEAAQQAAAGPLDSEAARMAQEARWRQLLGQQGQAWSFLGGG
ncbi:MAG: hypothetical protein HZA68_13005 [Rhodovulum sp.]|nr:hypothetical protein [Rhodovulum sp.]